MSREVLEKIMPWGLIFFLGGGFYLLIQGMTIVAGGCMVIGIIMLLNRVWPEEWSK